LSGSSFRVRRLRARVFGDASIKRKVVLITMITSSATLLLAGATYVTYDLITFRHAMTRDLVILAQIIGGNSTGALAFDDDRMAKQTLASLSAEPHIVAACLYGKDGRLFATYDRDTRTPGLAGGARCRVPERGYLDVSRPVLLDGGPVGAIYIKSDLEELYSRLKRYGSIGVMVMLASSLVGWLLSARLQRVISAPILHLVETAKAIGDQMDYSVRAVKRSDDEVGRLIQGFNDMLAQIEKRDAALTRLSNNLNQLYRLSTSMQEPLSLQEQLTRVLEGARQVVVIDRFYIWAVVPEAQKLRALAGAGFSEDESKGFEGAEIPLAEAGAMEKAYREGVALVFNAANPLPPELRLKPPYSAMKAIRAKSFLVIPMIARGQTVGLLTADNKWTRAPIESQTVDLLQIFASHAAVAVENARLFREIEEKSQQLEVASRHKSEFLANMSHELRTPLNAIIGYSEMLQEEAHELEQDSFVADLQKINGAGKHLLELINGVLDLSKVEAGKMELYLETFSVRAMVDDVVPLIQPLAEKNGNRLDIHITQNVGAMRSDLTKVRQSLFNLLSNACKFTEQGTVALTVARETAPAGDSLVFTVRDTGIGMTSEQMGRLFQEFSQADADTSRKYGGTGLGLALSRRLCRMMGGDIEAASEPGRGSTFTITLPANADDAKTSSTARGERRADALAGARGTVLVIDDEPAVRELMQRFLVKEGFRVATATDGEEGLRLARELRPDVITLDVMMPGMDGWAVLSTLKAEPELAAIPVIMLTIVDDKNQGYALGAEEYLTKPVDRDRLMAILNRYRRNREGTSSVPPVLVVDDEPMMRDLLCRLLEAEGCAVIEAENGRVALERVREAPPGLILLDLVMPVMDGFEFVTEFRKKLAWRAIPIVILTAKVLSEAERRQLDGDVAKILQKGAYTRDSLLREVGDMVAACLGRPTA
jgi:signal transduction histidine kinase/CheY-like chemotaxis protein